MLISESICYNLKLVAVQRLLPFGGDICERGLNSFLTQKHPTANQSSLTGWHWVGKFMSGAFHGDNYQSFAIDAEWLFGSVLQIELTNRASYWTSELVNGLKSMACIRYLIQGHSTSYHSQSAVLIPTQTRMISVIPLHQLTQVYFFVLIIVVCCDDLCDSEVMGWISFVTIKLSHARSECPTRRNSLDCVGIIPQTLQNIWNQIPYP